MEHDISIVLVRDPAGAITRHPQTTNVVAVDLKVIIVPCETSDLTAEYFLQLLRPLAVAPGTLAAS